MEKTYKEELEYWYKRRAEIKNENKRLIAYWQSIPWWKFWLRISFEEQRQIILDNWNKMPPPPHYEFNFILTPAIAKQEVG